jgi:CheY-like chemotaxis protein
MSYAVGKAVSVFISYSHVDRFPAEQVARRLSEVGYAPWIDFAGILGGTEWRKSIEDALNQCSALLVILTPDAVVSEWVRYEISRAKASNFPIIPLMFRPCMIPNELESVQYIDCTRDFEIRFNDLQKALLNAIASRQNRQAPEPQPITNQPTTSAHQKPLALVIEDVTYYRELLRDVLEGIGLEAHIAATRNESLSLLREHTYDFITLDMQLGPGDELKQEELGQDGLFMLSWLKRNQPETPIVIISTLEWNEQGDERIANAKQVKGILRKPLNEFAHDRLWQLVEQFVNLRK